MSVEVALAVVPPKVVVVKGKAELVPDWSGVQPNMPPLQVSTLPELQVVSPPPVNVVEKRFVEDAVVEKMLVVVAFVRVVLRETTRSTPTVVVPALETEKRVEVAVAVEEPIAKS